MKHYILILTILTTACAPVPTFNQSEIYPGPDSYLIGKQLEDVAKTYGNPQNSNSVGSTLFVSYKGYGRTGNNYSNICFLELQAESMTGVIRQVKLGSNLGIDNLGYGLNVRQDCNRIFLRQEFLK